jgi:hypothetical protein
VGVAGQWRTHCELLLSRGKASRQGCRLDWKLRSLAR